ncbi:MAG: response regulator [Bacteroidales bacterium]|jgi:signal transduction histidine kinase/CheY-like chemotaxis protein/HAMP domain-containing protein|nr:response regulator [Bacteroidales bacterium]
MKKIKFKSIRTRLTFWFLILALLPLLTGFLVSYDQQKRSIEQETFNKLTAIRDLKAEQVERWLDERLGDIQVMSGDYEIRGLENIFEKKSKSTEGLKKFETSKELLSRYLKNFDDYSEIFIINPNTGLIGLSTNPERIGENKSDNLYFTVPIETGEIYIKDIHFYNDTHNPEMTFSIPIFGMQHNTHIVGILVARINLDETLYNSLLDRVGLGKTGETLIVNKDVIAINELRYFENAPLELKIEAKPAINAAAGKTGITQSMDYRGKEVLAAYTYIQRTGWGFVCKQDMEELNVPIWRMIWQRVILFLITVILVFIVTFIISKSIAKPIVGMDRVAQKIREGDLSVRNNIESKDELGSLAQAFNTMTDAIQSGIKIRKEVADISRTVIEQSSLQEFGSELLKQLMKITDASMSTFYILNEATSEYKHFASVGANQALLKTFDAENPEGEFGNAIATKSIFYLRDIPDDSNFKFKTTAGDLVPKEIITIPVLIEGTVVALISLVNINKFSNEAYEVLNQSWQAINTSYSGLLLNERTRILADSLTRTNQQLEAQSEELQEQAEELQEQTNALQLSSEELQEQNLELEAQRNQVESANKLKSEFLSNTSHELRTPLNSINALSQILIMQAKNKLNDDENNYLEIIERNGKRLLSLINNILDLSKIEVGRMDILPQVVSTRSLLTIIRESMQTLAENKGISLDMNFAGNMPNIETDESKMHQVLLNIVSNAVKFTEKGSVMISANYDKENVFIEIKDTGIGISEEMLPHIFDEFRQADGSSSRQYEGTGLGLAIANKLITALGGKIKVESKLGEGSVFTITFPVKWHDKTNIVNTADSKTNISAPKSKIKDDIKTGKDISQTRILLVEDNQDAIIQVKSILEREGYQIDIAIGGQEALDYVKHTIPDGIILDLMMPEIDGFEVLEKMRSSEVTKNIPVLILTAKDLTRSELSILSSNNIQQLINKGNVDINGLLFKLRLMLGNKPDLKTKPETDLSVEVSKAKDKNLPDHQSQKNKVGKPNVLIVEDNMDSITTIKAILGGKYNITEAFDGEQGLKSAQSQIPDMILLDMSLPKMDGEEIVKILKENKKTKNIPVIAITARVMKGDKEQFLKAGCNDYVAKPIDHEELKEKITNLLKK